MDALLAHKQAVRALVRAAEAAGAQALRARGVEVVAAGQENSESLQRALTEVAALFFMTTFAGDARDFAAWVSGQGPARRN
ncbi:NmrA family NAD(P)-binding protein [Nonomuraea sp. NPDC049158]|uniref:NmrA family NAD(P)-binding protein n=1 Tax=Nonomuraea sp. NPDC049158 TaxID=3155649 RepID=UPI0033EBB37D